MSSIIPRLREKHPALTPPFAGDTGPDWRTILGRQQPLTTSTDLPENLPTIRRTQPREPVPISQNTTILPPSQQRAQQAGEALSDLQNEPLTFGTDAQGNVRYAPQTGFKHRLIAGLKVAGQGARAGARYGPFGALGGAVTGGIRGTMSPELPAQLRRQQQIGQAAQQYGQQLGAAGEEARIAQEQAQTQNLIQVPERLKAQQEERERGLDLREQGLQQQRQRDEDAQLLRYYNSRTDFDPEDPAEAGFVSRWQARFGYKPAKNVRGSQLATVTGYDADGKPMVSIINQGKNTATAVTGETPPVTEGQLNRQQRAGQFQQAEAGRNVRAANRPSRQQTDKRLASAQTALRQFEELRGKATYADPDKRAAAMGALKAKQQAIDSTFGDLIETGTGSEGTPYAKLRAQQAEAPTRGGRQVSEAAIRAQATQRNLDPDEAIRRAKLRQDIQLIP